MRIPKRITKPKQTSGQKLFVLVCLVLQTSATVLIMQSSRRTSDPDKVRYATSTAVVLAEFFKMCVGILHELLYAPSDKGGRFAYVFQSSCANVKDLLKMSVPAILYMIQNNLLFVALSNLESAVYQVVYQVKILTTALFAITMLGQTQSKRQWIALLMLFCGAALAQFATSSPPTEKDTLPDRNIWLGLAACLSATVTSGFNGVYTEKVLKTTKPSLWVRNIQLGLFGSIAGFMTVYVKDSEHVFTHGFFGGYDYSTWTCIALNTLGGYLVALVLKTQSNIIKAFANGFAIIVVAVFSVFLFGFELNFFFGIGALLVACAVYIYQSAPKVKKKTKGRI